MVNTPILLLVFNRPDKTRELIRYLARYRPPKIYVGADGPRNIDEKELVKKTREVIETLIDWPCEIRTLYREKNLGLRVAVSEAITWFFGSEEAGIILEDDCLPGESFLRLCDKLLPYYANHSAVMHISGFNAFVQDGSTTSYHFSKYPRVWGWATWKRAWDRYCDDNADYANLLESPGELKRIFPNATDRAFWSLIMEKMAIPGSRFRKGSWAYYWALSIRLQDGICVTPNQNLIQNIGFDATATHTKESGRLAARVTKLSASELTFPLMHPTSLELDTSADKKFLENQLIDSRFKMFKVWLKAIFPFLKPRS